MARQAKKGAAKKPPLTPVYITGSIVKTTEGQKHHGDRVALPPDEAAALIAKGLAK